MIDKHLKWSVARTDRPKNQSRRVAKQIDFRSHLEELEARLCLDAAAQFLGDLSSDPVSANAGPFVAANDFVYFAAFDAQHGRELWRTDGTKEGSMLVKDIRPGPEGSYTSLYPGYGSALTVGNVLIFTANDGVHGNEMWRSDGTSAGTFMLRDISTVGGAYPRSLHAVGSDVYFAASANQGGHQLWKTDGSQSGTVLVKDFADSSYVYISQMLDLNNQLIFVARDDRHGQELWSSDGTAEGTSLVRDNNPEGDGVIFFCGHQRCTDPPIKHPTLDRVFFTGNDGTGSGLWVSDGTAAGTHALTKSNSDNFFSPVRYTPVADEIFFVQQTDETSELWKSDGTRTGTVLVRDFGANTYPSSLFAVGDTVYFRVFEEAHGDELWKSDGTAQGTVRMELNPDDGSNPAPLAVLGDTFFFSANDGQRGAELWKSNDAGTSVVKDINPSPTEGSYPNWATPLGDRLIFGTSNRQIWATDEAAEDAVMLYDGRQDGYGYSRGNWQGQLFFTGRDGQVWSTDGTVDGTQQVTEIPIATQNSEFSTFVNFRGRNYFLANGRSATGLYAHDPITNSTERIGGQRFGNVDSLQVFQDRLVFLGGGRVRSSDGIQTISLAGPDYVQAMKVVGDTLYQIGDGSLWKNDGPRLGTEIVKRSINGTQELTALGDTLFFLAYETNFNGQRLWRSDGTEAGTTAVSGVIRNLQLSGLTTVGDRVFFSAFDGRRGELWQSDGTSAGTSKVKDVLIGRNRDGRAKMQALGDLLIFNADDGEHGAELWISDGTADGTRMIADLDRRESAIGSNPGDFTRVGNATYFTAQSAPDRIGIWKISDDDTRPERVGDDYYNVSDLTAFGDRLLFVAGLPNGGRTGLWITDENGTGASSLRNGNTGNITVIGTTAYFTNNNFDNRTELWKSDGTRDGTLRVANIFRRGGANPSDLTAVGDTLYFVATDGVTGRELWKTQGTEESTTIVRDVNPGLPSSYPSDFKVMGESVLFFAEDSAAGRELWISDGSHEGTQRVTDLRADVTNDSLADEYAQVGDWTYFVAEDGIHGRELWRTNGTAAGTELVQDLRPGPTDAAIAELQAVGVNLFFTASNSGDTQRNLWVNKSNGTTAEELTTEISGRQVPVVNPRDFAVLDGRLHFSAQVGCCDRGLFQVELGAGESTARQLPAASDPANLTVVGNRLFFSADDGLRGRELWQTDGTAEGTELVMDIFNALAVASTPGQFVQVGNDVFFTAQDSSHGTELWVTDGTVEGTRIVTDLRDGSASSQPQDLIAFGGELVFSAEGRDDKVGRELWISDGTSQGTHTVKNLNHVVFPSDPQSLVIAGDNLFFFAGVSGGGVTLWKSDGTSQGTRTLSNTGASSINSTEQIVPAGDNVYFVATTETHGRELWMSNGTTSGTKLVKDVRPGSGGSISTNVARHKLVPHGSMLYFAANSDGRLGAEIWVTDGTDAGTSLVHDPRIGNPLPLDVANGWLYFSNETGDQGNELWRTDGTAGNTMLVADLSPGTASSIFFPHGEFTPIRPDTFLFPAITSQWGSELWVTDGTAAGTHVLDLEPGSGSTKFGNLVQVQTRNNLAYFFAAVPSRGQGLWKSDGTLAGTELVLSAPLDPWPDLTLVDDMLLFGVQDESGNLAQYQNGEVQYLPLKSPDEKGSSAPDELTMVGDRLYFVADDGAHGREVWQSDGTIAGTRILADLVPGFGSVDPQAFTVVGEQIFFSAETTSAGRELWTMSLAGENARMVRDILPGASSSSPSTLLRWNEQLVFVVNDPTLGASLWISDGTDGGTRPLTDLVPDEVVVHQSQLFVLTDSSEQRLMWRFDNADSAPVQVTQTDVRTIQSVGERLFFTANDPKLGYEPWVSDGTVDGSRLLLDVNSTTPGSDPSLLSIHQGNAYFLADSGQGRQLWQSDGTTVGTRTVSSFVPDLLAGTPLSFWIASDGVYLTQANAFGTELWKIDPQSAQAERAWADTNEQHFKRTLGVSNERLFFLASQPTTGTELWVSDGTAAGTRLVHEITPGSDSAGIADWTPYQNGHIFVATEPSRGAEMWFTDGTAVGTYPIADIHPGPSGAQINSIHVEDDLILFAANDGVHGREVWVSDGTAEGTRMRFNVDTSTISSDPAWLTVVDDGVFFAATNDQGRRLWHWSPSMDAPVMVSSSVSNPSEFATIGGAIYFSGFHPDVGQELWVSDGSEAGTRLLLDLIPGSDGSSPQAMRVTDDGGLYFSAIDSVHGREAWWLPIPDGDTDADRDIDFLDFLKFATHFGQQGTRQEGDFNQDGMIDFADFLLLAANFGRHA